MKGKELESMTLKGWLTISFVNEDKFAGETKEDMLDIELLLTSFQHRINNYMQQTGLVLGEKIKGPAKMKPLDAWNDCQPFRLNSMAIAYGEYVAAREFKDRIDKDMKDADTKEVLLDFCRLYILDIMARDLATFRENDYMSSDCGKWVKEHVVDLCSKLKEEALVVCDAMGPEERLMNSALADTNGQAYKSLLNKVYSAKGCFERPKFWESIRDLNQF